MLCFPDTLPLGPLPGPASAPAKPLRSPPCRHRSSRWRPPADRTASKIAVPSRALLFHPRERPLPSFTTYFTTFPSHILSKQHTEFPVFSILNLLYMPFLKVFPAAQYSVFCWKSSTVSSFSLSAQFIPDSTPTAAPSLSKKIWEDYYPPTFKRSPLLQYFSIY